MNFEEIFTKFQKSMLERFGFSFLKLLQMI